MNLFQLNSGVKESVLSSANYDIRCYIEFINKSIAFLKNEAYSVKIDKEEIDGITRYIPEPPATKEAEKAIEILFDENTKSIFEDNRNFKNSIRITDKNEDENYITLETPIQVERLFLKPDIYQLEKQKKALEHLLHRPLKEHQPLLNLFGNSANPVWYQNINNKNFSWRILSDETKEGVNEQRKFVSKAIQTQDFALLEGPPGSGKTTTIIELILQYAAEGKRILLCSATHAAVDNVIERIKGRYKDICEKEIVAVRISRMPNPVKESVRPYLLNNLDST
jgi:primosomal protein N'